MSNTGELVLWPQLVAELGDSARDSVATPAGLHLRVDAAAWASCGRLLKQTLGFTYFSYLSAVDWLPNPNLDGEHAFDPSKDEAGEQAVITDPVVRIAGGESRFQVIARVENLERRQAVTVTADLQDDSPSIASWASIYRGADWHEREAWEMFGIVFEGHPDLRHIYLPDEFEGFPLRKDYPLIARIVRPWPGLVDMEEMPPPPAEPTTSDAAESVVADAAPKAEEGQS